MNRPQRGTTGKPLQLVLANLPKSDVVFIEDDFWNPTDLARYIALRKFLQFGSCSFAHSPNISALVCWIFSDYSSLLLVGGLGMCRSIGPLE